MKGLISDSVLWKSLLVVLRDYMGCWGVNLGLLAREVQELRPFPTCSQVGLDPHTEIGVAPHGNALNMTLFSS